MLCLNLILWATWWQCQCPWCYKWHHHWWHRYSQSTLKQASAQQLPSSMSKPIFYHIQALQTSFMDQLVKGNPQCEPAENPFFRTSRSVHSFHVSLLSENTWTCATEICLSLLSVFNWALVGKWCIVNQTSIVTQGRVSLISHDTIMYAISQICLATAREVTAQCSVKTSELGNV